MAAPSYTDNFNQVIFEDDTGTNFTLVSSGGGGQNSLTQPETDDYIQGNDCVSRNPWSNAARGMVYQGPAVNNFANDNALWIWAKADISKALETYALPADAEGAGVQVLVGDGTSLTTNLNRYYVDGSETYEFGGWRCYVVDPTFTPSVNNTSATLFSHYGMLWNIPGNGPSKGFPFKIDAIRSGSTFTIVFGDATNGYATFEGFANTANADANRWGCFNENNGVYILQGTIFFGNGNDPVDFRDSNRTILIADTPWVSSSFNGFTVRNDNARIDWTNISITSLANTTYGSSTVARGEFGFSTSGDLADINFESCTFVNMGTFEFGVNSTINATTFRGCGQIKQGQATITNCTIADSTATSAVLLDNSGVDEGANLNNTDFTSSGTGHAIEINQFGGSSLTLNNVTFSNYAGTPGSTTGTTGNEAVFINRTGNFTINVNGGDTPSDRDWETD